MNDLQSKGIGCNGCEGVCCTYAANSMMVTPLEALELVYYLRHVGKLDPELRIKCDETVKKYRLNTINGNGRRAFIRRTYTCPLFNHKELGCPLPVEIKPYGCLAFNAHHSEQKTQEHCYSETNILLKREESDLNESSLNENLQQKFKLYWEKLPLPVALLEIWEVDINFDN